MKDKELELQLEKAKLKNTLGIVRELLQDIDAHDLSQRQETMEALRNMSYSDINQQLGIMADSAQSEEEAENYRQQYNRALKCPYFCRIDFAEEYAEEPQELYIGKCGITGKSGKQIVLDWRAPIANVYYANSVGKVSYEAPGGEVRGDLSLKRHYIIEDGELQSMMDIDISTNDDFLQMALGDSKDNRLKDIVSTIQSEQNEIIRAPLSMPLIVQGVAGSGKTTIALHRIAYLIYTYKEQFSPQDFLIMAPNNLFLDYISAVLPELGVEKVRQSTFADLAARVIGEKYKMEDSDRNLIMLISPSVSGKEKDLLIKASRFKGSLSFLHALDQYISELTEEAVPDQDFVLGDHILYTYEQVKTELYLQSDIGWAERLQHLRKRLTLNVKKMREKIEEEIRAPYDDKIEEIRDQMPASEERRLLIVAQIEKRDQVLEAYRKECKTCVSAYMKLFPKINLLKDYRTLLEDSKKLICLSDGVLSPEIAKYMSDQSRRLGKKNTVEYEDLGPLMYLSAKLKGLEAGIGARFVAIDEAQDFNELQFEVLKRILKSDKFSIFGDLSQGIHGYRGVQDWERICRNIFQGKCEFRILEQSYRTTVEIMNFANQVLSLISGEILVKANPVVRHGIKPQCISLPTEAKMIDEIERKVREHLQNMYSSVAVITKTDMDAQKIYKKLVPHFPDVRLLKDSDTVYHGGFMIVPAYLSKGLEFDAVIVACLMDDYTDSSLDIKLLYVAITRALHRMDIIHVEGKMEVISRIEK